MGFIALVYVCAPSPLIAAFEGSNDPAKWEPIAEKVVVLLWFVAAFSIFDAANIVVAFGLRGAGDTLFVSLLTLCLAWPVMVAPTYFLAYREGWGLYWAWAFATLYICTAACCLLIRFRQGKWRTMRVIEAPVIESPAVA